MKNLKLFISAILILLLISACNNKQKQSRESIEAPVKQEMEEFTEAAEKVTNMLQPKSASLVFTLDGTTYRLGTTDVKATIIPFTHYKPANTEEGETQESSLIWMQGTDTANRVEITFSVSLNEKFANGNFVANEGEVIISKEGKSNYYKVKSISLIISNLKEKKFRKELSAYSLDMSFGGTIAEFRASGKSHEIKEGKYIIRY